MGKYCKTNFDLIAKLCSNLLETGFQIMQPCHLARC